MPGLQRPKVSARRKIKGIIAPSKGARGAARPATGGAPRPPVAPGRTAPQRSKFPRPSAKKAGRKLPTTIGGRGRSRLRFGG